MWDSMALLFILDQAIYLYSIAGDWLYDVVNNFANIWSSYRTDWKRSPASDVLGYRPRDIVSEWGMCVCVRVWACVCVHMCGVFGEREKVNEFFPDSRLSVRPSACLYLDLSVSLAPCLSVCLSVFLPASQPAYLSLSIALSVCLSTCLAVCLPLCLSVCLTLRMSLFLCVYLPISQSVYLSVLSSACLYVSLSFCLFLTLSVCPPVFIYLYLHLCLTILIYSELDSTPLTEGLGPGCGLNPLTLITALRRRSYSYHYFFRTNQLH